jgi:hypothetical protein
VVAAGAAVEIMRLKAAVMATMAAVAITTTSANYRPSARCQLRFDV